MTDGSLPQATLDTLPFSVAVVDSGGDILLTNASWRAFEAASGGEAAAVGANYFEGIDEDAGDEGVPSAEGLRAVLGGERERFTYEYPCHSPTERRWFVMFASALSLGGERLAAVAHIDITDRKLAELEAERTAAELADERETRERLLERITGLLADVTELLVRADSREAVERGVAERAAAVPSYATARVYRASVAGDGLDAVASAGERGEADAATPDALSLDGDGGGPAVRAYREGDVVVADASDGREATADGGGTTAGVEGTDEERVNAEPTDGDGGSGDRGSDDEEANGEPTDGSDTATDDGSGVTAAVPLATAERRYGVLVVTAASGAFDARERTMLGTLGRVVANALGAVESRQLLGGAESGVEMECALASPDFYACALSAGSDATWTYRGTVVEDETVSAFLSVRGVEAEAARERARETASVRDAEVVAASGEECLLELVVERALATTVSRYGAALASMTARDGEASATLTVPDRETAHRVFRGLEETYGDVDLAGYREVERPERTREEFRAALAESLTGRQATALRRAYYSGYFESPRRVTGDDLAESMGVSRPTFHQHLRSAERKLLDAFLDAN